MSHGHRLTDHEAGTYGGRRPIPKRPRRGIVARAEALDTRSRYLPMPDIEPTPTHDPKRSEHATAHTVLDLMLGDDVQRPWTVHELALEIGSTLVVEDAIAELHGAGLVHKLADGFVFAARPAIRYTEVIGGPVA